ncbi:hypothetical protein [uncultured Jannaschia sp.]|uniref:hypothetical protein n=1 Tax=uncultured Jannaschia sp. TaxID=293347 RepID=UPI00260EF9B0|nr:hypothetical protein [uncultured Jannaschia sp.]
MAEQGSDPAELEARLARLEAALGAAGGALEEMRAAAAEAADSAAALDATRGELGEAQDRIAALESEGAARDDALKAAETRADAAEERIREFGDTTEIERLHGQLEELKAARAQDLAEMKALLAELEPMLETEHA